MMSTQAPGAVSARPTVADIPPSCVHEVFRAVTEYEAAHGVPALGLHVGEPAFRPPAAVADAVLAAVRDGRTGYTTAEGLLELRSALVDKLRTRNGHDTDTDLVFVTPGSTQGLMTLMHAVAAPDAEILLPSVHWPIHLQQSLLTGLRPVFYPLDDRMRPDVDALARIGGDRPRTLLLNSPNNPTGAVCGERHLLALLDLAHSRGWTVISDEAYEDFAYDEEHISLARLERNVSPHQRRVFSAFSFSKGYGMTGWRLGYVTAPNERHAAAVRTVQEASIMCPPEPVQLAGIAALGRPECLAANKAMVRHTRDTALRPLLDTGLLARLPEGGWYALLDCRTTGLDADTFAARLLAEHGVALAAGPGFALRPLVDAAGQVRTVDEEPQARGLLRLAFCGETETVREGVSRVARFAATL
ncbi:pyridoxal phosphate-dependent aminotransferase [Streptomyces sp. ICBB 8177]|uniref:pyridoxal phosphate-dependent aminotransferase n=1 Tax=Streptomyces sp. ICBB 8177 TaxID=563922 RepID=UPI000D684ECC|nr:pyridoxal phosphate-dependent aminotransferase [Streptomyces sp. ICBB 8177]PWI44782.1 hypothetical protein CK485_06125 [Streptomyces sp. ICBB 8177]